MKIRPLHDRVVVKRIESESKSAGGIVIPDTAAEKPDQGEIVAVGKGKKDENGKLIPTLPTLARVAMVFDVGLDYFFGSKRRAGLFEVVKGDERMRFPSDPETDRPNFFFEVLAFKASFETEYLFLVLLFDEFIELFLAIELIDLIFFVLLIAARDLCECCKGVNSAKPNHLVEVWLDFLTTISIILTGLWCWCCFLCRCFLGCCVSTFLWCFLCSECSCCENQSQCSNKCFHVIPLKWWESTDPPEIKMRI